MGVCQNTKSNKKQTKQEKQTKEYSKDNTADTGGERQAEAEEKIKNKKGSIQSPKEKKNTQNIIKSNQLALTNDVLISRNEINPEKIYNKIKILGTGAFGEVWLVKHKDLKKDFAMKLIKKKKK